MNTECPECGATVEFEDAPMVGEIIECEECGVELGQRTIRGRWWLGMFWWPGKIPSKQVSDVTLTSMDLLPLFCELAGVKQPGDRKIIQLGSALWDRVPAG